tara:strand:- start:1890 stop:2072 length:183 start_codon:yes stop_codon:yes gene_type:complete
MRGMISKNSKIVFFSRGFGWLTLDQTFVAQQSLYSHLSTYGATPFDAACNLELSEGHEAF